MGACSWRCGSTSTRRYESSRGGPQDSATGLTTTEKGWEGFPLGVVEAHSYGYELAAMYALVFAYFTLAGPGKLALGSGDLADKK